MIKRKISAIVFILLIGTTLACTIPIYFGSEPEVEEKIVYVEITSTPDEAEAEAETETDEEESEDEVVLQVNMDGLWTIWRGSNEQRLSIDFLQKGSDVVGNTATDDGHSLLFVGTIGSDGKTVNGTWESTSGTSGDFMMEFSDEMDSFSGNLGGGVPLCGSRTANAKPSPCLK